MLYFSHASQNNHVELVRKNYEKLPLCLSKVGCAYANIWILWTSKDVTRLTDSTHIEKELQDCKCYISVFDGNCTILYWSSHWRLLPTDSAMLKASPEDKMLIQMVETANRRLREIQLQEEDHAKDIPGDDLVYTKVGWNTEWNLCSSFVLTHVRVLLITSAIPCLEQTRAG